MVPLGVRSRQPLLYWKACPGWSSGWAPTTPRPLTSSAWPSASVMIQWREMSCAAISPVLLMVILYAKLWMPCYCADCSGRYWGTTSTSNWYLAMARSYSPGRFAKIRR